MHNNIEPYAMVRNMAIDSHILMSGSSKSVESRMRQVEMLQYQVGQIVCGIIIKEYLSR